MRLITARIFAKRYFDEDCRPDLRTVRVWVEKGTVAGKVINQHVYIDADSWERSTGFALADKIMGAA